nr:Gag-Pol polyprotein [Tanacetum cinerariifolium]
MKEKEVQALKYIERRLQDNEMQKQESLVPKGTSLEDCLVTDGAELKACLITEGSTIEACLVTKGVALEACLVNEGITMNDNTGVTDSSGTDTSRNENRSSDHESISSGNDADDDIGPSYGSVTVTEGLGFENKNDNVNPNVLSKAKELAPCLYNIDEMGKDELSDHKIIFNKELKLGEKKILFENETSSFETNIMELEMTLDIYDASSETRPPMLNKENYVLWSPRLLRYAKSKPNGKLLVNSIKNGPYVRQIIHEPGDPNSVPLVAESTHEQTDDELTDK